MIPYFLLVALPLLAHFISPQYRLVMKGKRLCETRTLPLDAFMLGFMLMLAFRGTDCGSDTIQYLRLFRQYSRLSMEGIFQKYDHELGYKLLNKLIYVLGGDYQVLLGITAIVCVWPLWHFYRRETDDQLLTIALFLYVAPFVMYFSGIRQSIAMSLGILAWYAARKRKLIRFLLIVFLAIQFHNSAFMLLCLYPLYRVKITRKWLWAVVPCILAIFAFRKVIFTYLLSLLWDEFGSISTTGATSVLLLLILFSVYSYMVPDESKMDSDMLAMRNILLLSAVLQIFAMLHPLSMRMNYYFLIFVPALIPKVAGASKNKYKQITKLSTIVMTVYFMYAFINNVLRDNDVLNIFPYIPFWAN